MAAAEYYGGGGLPQPPHHQQQAPRPAGPPQQQSHNPLPYPISDAPPPYSLFADQGRPQSHSQPPPQNRLPVNPNYTPQGSGYPPQQPSRYLPEKQGHGTNAQPGVHFSPQAQQQQKPQGYGSPYPQPPPQQGHPFPNGVPPSMSQAYAGSNRRTSSTPVYPPAASPYRDDYEGTTRDRSRSQSRKRHHHHHYERPQPQKKKSSGVSTFLGAGGGAIIGDVIFPGLGTIGGAILGGLGGHEYEREKKSYDDDARKARTRRSYSDQREYRDDDYDKRGRRQY